MIFLAFKEQIASPVGNSLHNDPDYHEAKRIINNYFT